MKDKGIMHSTHERFWKQIFACGAQPFYWRQGEGKEVIWAMLEKSLMRQKVFLHCAMDHDTVHDLNEECVHVKNTGFDIETIKRCTEHPESSQVFVLERQKTLKLDQLPSLEA